MIKINVFDLDNTLVFTDKLNNESYNFALQKTGKGKISGEKRITREMIRLKYDSSEEEIQRIVSIKQAYFIKNINKIQENDELLLKLKSLRPDKCVLWTKAEKVRVDAILNYLHINNCFSNVLYSSKRNLEEDLKIICSLYNRREEDLIFYDDVQHTETH